MKSTLLNKTNQLKLYCVLIRKDKNKPEWAKFATIDSNGDVYYWEKKPIKWKGVWVDIHVEYLTKTSSEGKVRFIRETPYKDIWEESLIEL